MGQAGGNGRVRRRRGPAGRVMAALLAEGRQFDVVHVDGVKSPHDLLLVLLSLPLHRFLAVSVALSVDTTRICWRQSCARERDFFATVRACAREM